MREEPPGPAVIGRGITVKGDLVGEGDIVVEGRVEGRVNLNSALTVSATGDISAEVRARSVLVHGRMRGNVEVSERFAVGPTGIVSGDVRASALVIEDGGVLRGRIEMEVELPDDLQVELR